MDDKNKIIDKNEKNEKYKTFLEILLETFCSFVGYRIDTFLRLANDKSFSHWSNNCVFACV